MVRRLHNVRVRSAIVLLAAVVCSIAAPRAFAQDSPQALYAVVPLESSVTPDMVAGSVAASSTIPMWNYTLTSPLDHQVYSGSMVGRSALFNGARTTNVTTFIVPLIIDMPDGGVFDPTVADANCSPGGTPLNLTQNSPMLVPIDFHMGTVDVGTAQYVDAFQRGNFWSKVSVTGNRYHTVLSPVTTLPPVTVTVPAGDGATFLTTGFGGCNPIGVMTFNWFESFLRNTIVPGLAAQGVGPTNFPLFLMKDTVMSTGPSPTFPSACCVLGYHEATGNPTQTFSPFDFDTTGVFGGTTNISVMSHEVGEWMDDPLGNNLTPVWGHVGQVGGCQGNLETGDPLSGTLFPSVVAPNGKSYRFQELAFFSWFFRQSPSLGVNGWFSDNGHFTTDAGAVCM
jgi:hypothetical protein